MICFRKWGVVINGDLLPSKKLFGIGLIWCQSGHLSDLCMSNGTACTRTIKGSDPGLETQRARFLFLEIVLKRPQSENKKAIVVDKILAHASREKNIKVRFFSLSFTKVVSFLKYLLFLKVLKLFLCSGILVCS